MKAALLLVLTAVSLLSCTSGERSSIVIWTQRQPEGRRVLEDLLTRYQAQNPALRIRQLYYETDELRSKFIITALGGSGPELIYGPSDMVAPLVEMELLLPLEQYLPRLFLDQFDPRALVSLQGHTWQIGDSIGNHLALLYNKALVPTPPKTMAELIALGKTLTRDDNGDGIIDTYALVWNYREPFNFIPFLGGFGGRVFDEQGRPDLNKPATAQALKFIADLRNVHRIVPGDCDYDLANSMFKQGKAAMIINGPWSYGEYLKAGMQLGIARLPLIDQTGLWPAPLVSPLGYVANRNIPQDKLLAVLRLLAFLLSPEAQLSFTKAMATLPSHKVAQESPEVKANEMLANSMAQMEVGLPMPVRSELRAVWDGMRPGYQAVFNGSMTPEQAAAAMQSTVERYIKEMQAQ